MDERTMQLRVGLMALITLLITGILVAMFGEMPKLIYGEYKVDVLFDQAPGVNEGTPVRKSGILIGRVSKVQFTEDDSKVLVTLAIQDQWKVRHNEVCRVESNILGDASLEFLRSRDKGASKELIEGGEQIQGVYAPSPNQMIANLEGQFHSTIDSVQDTSQDLGVASKQLAVTLDNLNVILLENREGVRVAIEQANEILKGTKSVIGDEETQKNLRAAVEELPQMIRDTHDTVIKMRETVVMVDRNLQNLDGFTRPLGERGEVLIGNLEKGTKHLDQLVSEMLQFSQALNSSEGTVGQLINNPSLYQHLNRAAANIDEISRQLKPIVSDARVFSDKIARHPELLGVRGAIEKRPGIK